MSNIFGHAVTMTIFGESHGVGIGIVLDGLPVGVKIDFDAVRQEMARRAPGKDAISTARSEKDAFEVQSGIFNEYTTGAPLCCVIKNKAQRSKDYSQLRHMMRPGHADYTGKIRYDGFNDYRGGGHFSGRITAPLVFAGAIAAQILEDRGVTIGSHILQIADVKDTPFNPLGETVTTLEGLKKDTVPTLDKSKAQTMVERIITAKENVDSVGGIIEAMAIGLPAGLGNPFFDSVESVISHMIFSVPATKGIEFGDGFGLASMKGSMANDSFYYDEEGQVKTRNNHNGGINGGITNGMPIVFRVAIKPTASISQEQQTIDTDTKENCTLLVKGRHDPCIVQRAVPVIEAATAWAILDVWQTTQQGR